AASGRGIFTALQRALDEAAEEQGIELVLGFGNDVTNPVFFDRLGWADGAHYRIWARPVLRRGAGEAGALDVDGNAPAGWLNHHVRGTQYLRGRYVVSQRQYEQMRSDRGHALVWAHKSCGPE